jgi:hypothetical protein
MADNSAALRRARHQDGRSKRQLAVEAISAMDASGEPITFPAVARRAGVSVSLLYGDPELSRLVAALRDRQHQAGRDRAWSLPARSLVTEQSLRADLANVKEQNRRMSEEIKLLRERLSRQLGADADVARGEALGPALDLVEYRAAELEADNHRHHARIVELETERRELTETLDAARAMNRELMSEMNRRASADPSRR